MVFVSKDLSGFFVENKQCGKKGGGGKPIPRLLCLPGKR